VFCVDGILNIDKPPGMTSHDVVDAVRRKFRISKAGHLGTLDPIATGVLPLAIGKATRIAPFIPKAPKEYEGRLRLGFATTTYDREGTPEGPERPIHGDLEEAMRSLTGTIDQLPPPYSAKKIGGVPAYKLARRNRPVALQPVRVEIREFEVLGLDLPFLTFRVVCSPGTYIRSLVHDLGQRLECGAHLTALRRTRSGEFTIANAVELERVSMDHLIPSDRVLTGLPRIVVPEPDENRLAHGGHIRTEAAVGLACIFNKKGRFIAVVRIENGWAIPRVVLT
jgi:tRNA pseudouridine55 synthase